MTEIPPTSHKLDEIGNQLLERNISFIERLQVELSDIESELDYLKQQIKIVKNLKTRIMLMDARSRLLDSYQKNLAVASVAYMASYKPLDNLIKYRDGSKKIDAIESTEQPLLPDGGEEEINLTQIYQKYED